MHKLNVLSPKLSSTASNESSLPYSKIDSLTGLRFVAAIMVFVHHLGGHFGVAATRLPLANNAVSFFFVLSGFILTIVYSKRFARRQDCDQGLAADVASFLKKRIARLWPLHFVCLLICVATVRYLNLDFWVVVTNLFLVHSWTGHAPFVTGLNNVSWSVSTELFFCFAFPVLTIGGYRRFLRRYALLIFGTLGGLFLLHFAVSQQWINRQNMTLIIQANPLMRLFEFATGIFAAYHFTRKRLQNSRTNVVLDTVFEFLALGLVVAWWVVYFRFGIQGLVYSVPLLSHSLGTWVWFCSAAPLFAVVVHTFARSSGLLSQIMASRLMVHLGEISFAVYLIHMIVIRVVDTEGDPLLITGGTAVALSLVASLAAAHLLFKFVELPMKDGMTALLDGRPKQALVESTNAMAAALRKPLTAISACALLAAAMTVQQYSVKKYEQRKIGEIVRKSSEEFAQITFGDSAKLRGCLLNVDQDAITLELAWEASHRNLEKRRTVYCFDQNMKPLATDKIPWRLQSVLSEGELKYDVIKLDRTEFPSIHRVMLAWEDKDSERATLYKDGRSSSVELLELYCADPELAAIDTFSLPSGKLRRLIETMTPKQSYVRLGNHATLCGYEVVPNRGGELEVNLAWKLNRKLTERRVLNFLNDDEAVVGNHGDVALLQFVRRKMADAEEAFFLDEISVPREKFQGASIITLGLWNSEARKMVQIQDGDTVSNGQRLVIGEIKEIEP